MTRQRPLAASHIPRARAWRRSSVLALAVLSLAQAACTNHFAVVAREATFSDNGNCRIGVVIKKLTWYAYAVTACNETAYYRCYFEGGYGTGTECCYRVHEEGEATDLIGPSSIRAGEETCHQF
jgi:hypothetical protein